MNWAAVGTSLKLALWTSALLLAVGVPLAYWLAFSGRRWKFLVESAVALPLVLPPTVLGFYVLIGMGPRSPIGWWYERWFGSTLPFTLQGLVVASSLYSLPFAVQPFTAAFRAVDPRQIEASWVLGVSRLGTFARVILPQSIPGLATGAVLTFAHTIGEFGVVLMVGGNIQGVTRTVSIDIYDRVQSLDYAGAGRTSLVLLIFSFTVVSIVYGLNRRAWTVGPEAPR